MRTVNLTISERVNAVLPILNEAKGGLVLMKRIYDDFDQIAITQAEWEAVNKNESSGDDGSKIITWDATKDSGKEINLHEEVFDYLKEKLNEKDKNKEFKVGDKQLINLLDKLS
jgi:hypothetical protein